MNGRPRGGKCSVPIHSVKVPFANHFCRTASSSGRCPDSIDHLRNITVYATSVWRRCKGLRLQMPVVDFFFLGKSSSRFCGCSFTARSWLRTRWTHFSAGGLHARRALAEVHSQINKHEGCHSDTPNQLHFVLLLSFFFSIDVYIDLFVASH